MSRSLYLTLAALSVSLLMSAACDSKKDPVTSGREAVKEVVTQPFKTLEGAKDSLQQSEDKTKAALEEFEKESKQ
jgi:predicted outer membrane protein